MSKRAILIATLLLMISFYRTMPSIAGRVESVCTGFIGAQRFENLDVPAGAHCTLNGTHIDGNIKVGLNATLQANGVTVGGNIQAEGATAVTVNNNSTVGGSIQIKQGGSATVDHVQVTGDIQLEANSGALLVAQNRAGGNIQIVQNRGGAAITDNRINGNLQCKENTPAPTGGRNQAASFEDQCAGFAGQPAVPTPLATPVSPTPSPTPTAPVPTLPAPTPSGNDGCRGSIGAQRYENLEVPAGASCTLNGTIIDGNIKVGTNATLHAIAVVVGGNIQAESAADVMVNNTSTVGGSIQIKQGGSATIDQVQVTGDLQLESNRSTLGITNNRVGGNIQVTQNRGGVLITDNRIDGNLQCKENMPAPTGGRNQAASFEDQCAGFAGEPIIAAPAPTPGDTALLCVGTVGAQQYTNLIVPADANCNLIGTQVTGNLTVSVGATLQASGLAVGGHFHAQSAAVVTVNHNSTVSGDLRIKESGSATIDQVQIGGNLELASNQRALSATRNRVGGNLQIMGNAAGIVISNNTIDGALQCQNNLLLPLVSINQATSLEDQCATLALRYFLPVVAVPR